MKLFALNVLGLGEICEEDSDCTTLNSVCKNEVCSCADFYYPSNDQCLAGILSIFLVNFS